MPARDNRCAGGIPWIGSPWKKILPEKGSSRARMVRRSVVFPAPFAPTTLTISPCSTVMEMPCSTGAPP